MVAVDLADHIEHEVRDPDDVAAFVVDNDRKAAWCMRKLRQALAEVERIRVEAANELDAITAWRDDAVRGPQHDAEFFRALLVGYRHELERDHPDLPKTYAVPGGKLTRRKGRGRVEITDETIFCQWALDSDPDAVKVEPRRSRLTAKDSPYEVTGGHVVDTTTGEQVPCVVLVEGDDVYDAVPTTEPGADE